MRCLPHLLFASLLALPVCAAESPRTMGELLAASAVSDWREIDPANTLQLELDSGVVLIELAPAFAPHHVANIKALARGGWYDGLDIVRVQDNFVAQWGDPEGKRPIRDTARTLPAEFTVPVVADAGFTRLADIDGYAPITGFASGFPAARDAESKRTWLTHCYGMLGVGRDNAADSGGGSELYVVIGHAPRQLDRNTTVVGRVVWGIEHLSALPRGTGAMGFYAEGEPRVPIRRLSLVADLEPAHRLHLEALRTDTPLFQELIELRRNRRDEWYQVPAGHIDLCSVPLPVRLRRQER